MSTEGRTQFDRILFEAEPISYEDAVALVLAAFPNAECHFVEAKYGRRTIPTIEFNVGTRHAMAGLGAEGLGDMVGCRRLVLWAIETVRKELNEIERAQSETAYVEAQDFAWSVERSATQ